MSSRDREADGPDPAARPSVQVPSQAVAISSTEFARGDQIGDYVVLNLLGEGGMGVVYLAYDPKLERKVALKLLRRASSNEQSMQGTMDDRSRTFLGGGMGDATLDNSASRRLVREAQSMARLSHPNVVAVYQVGEVDDRVFIAMEYIEGRTLREWIDKEAPSSRELLNVLIQAGRGLQAAHEAGLVHRDFKAENILLGKDGRVCVTDFGLASSTVVPADGQVPVERGSSWQEGLSRSSWFIGTPRYMAPEQHLRQPTDARSDQFSFCVTLYYAMFGVWPYSGETYQEYAEAVTHGRLNPPPVRRRERWLRQIIQRGLSVDPARRHANMGALLAELDRKPKLRRNLMLAAGTLALASVAAFLAVRSERPAPCGDSASHLVGVWDKGRADAVQRAMLATGVPYAASTFQRVSDGLDEYANQWTAMHRSTCEATRVRGEQSEKLLDLRMACLERMKGEFGIVVDLVSKVDAETIAKSLESVYRLSPVNNCARIESLSTAVAEPSDPQQREHLHAMQKALDAAKAELNVGKFRVSLGQLTAIAPEVKKLDYPPLQAETLLLRGQLEWRLGELKKAEATLMESLAAAEEGRDDDKRALALIELTYVVGWEEGRVSEGLTWAKVAEGTLSRVASNERLTADFARSRASVMFRGGRYEDALKGNEESCSILRRLLNEHHRDVADCLSNMGNILVKLGRSKEALGYHNQALEVAEAALGKDHPSLGDFLNNAGNSYASLGEPKKAAAMYQRALELYKRSMGPNAPSVAVALSNLGSLDLEQKDFKSALKYFASALAIEEKALGPKHLSTAETLAHIGDTYLLMGNPEAAVPPLERAWAVHAERTPPPPEVAPVAFSLARALTESLEPSDRPISLARRARELAAAATGDEWKPLVSEIDDWLAEHDARHR